MIKLSTYIYEIEEKYTKARNEFSEVAKQIDQLDLNHRANIRSGNLNDKGIKREFANYNKSKRELQAKIRSIRNTFSVEIEEIRTRVDNVFKDLFKVNPEELDLRAVEILKSGMLTDSELVEMANDYKADGNLAMYRYCGTFADINSRDKDLRQLAVDSKKPTKREDLSIIDSFSESCSLALRDDVALSNGIDRHHDEFLQVSLSSAEAIRTD